MTAPKVIVIGGSAGALEPLTTIAAALPASFPIPLVAVLHIPDDFENTLPETIGRRCTIPVQEGMHGTRLSCGLILAPPNYHLLLEADGTVALSLDAPVGYSRPSIDVLFESAALAYGARVLGIVLSGANDDGARGLAAIRQAGGTVWVQDPQTASAAYMPDAALRLVGADRVAPPREIGTALLAFAPEAARNG
ncbi:MAG: chemotaxis protein CheB [Acidobacteria bacterium]|nr:chemotaxis protein CheB [Acidobacteriota bacterium]